MLRKLSSSLTCRSHVIPTALVHAAPLQTACIATQRSCSRGAVRCRAAAEQHRSRLHDAHRRPSATGGPNRRQGSTDTQHTNTQHGLPNNRSKQGVPAHSRPPKQHVSDRNSRPTVPGTEEQGQYRILPSKALSPQLLTSRIKHAAKPDDLLQLVEKYSQHFNYINTAAAITHLGQWHRDRQLNPGHHETVQQLLHVLVQLLLSSSQLQQCAPRQLSNIVWSCSLLDYNSADLYSSCLQIFMEKLMLVTDIQTVSSMLYGIAVAEQQITPEQFELLIDVVTQHNVLNKGVPQGISNIIWSAANLGHHIPNHQLQLMVTCFISKLAVAKPQEVSNVLWGIAAMRQSISDQQLQQLVSSLISRSAQARSQNFSNTFWAIATMEQQLPEQQLQQLLAGLVSKSADAEAQHASNCLWALARMNASVAWQPVQHLEAVLVRESGNMNAINIANALWACGHLRCFPQQLLTALQEQQLWQTLLPVMDTTCLAQVGWALGALGHRDDKLLAAVLQQTVERVQQQQVLDSGEGSHCQFTAQQVCNLSWSVAVLDAQQHIHDVLTLVSCSVQQFDNMDTQGLQQLHQVHLWLLDVQEADAAGLRTVLSEDQLKRCEAVWLHKLQQRATEASSNYQAEVFRLVQQLPLTWRTPPAMEQLCEPDGMFSIDISGVTADGVRLAIEADGPTHFRRPDNKPTGPTLYRNRALAARGYVVVSVPYFDWEQRYRTKQKQQYLMDLLQQQQQLHQDQQHQEATEAPAVHNMQRRRRQQRLHQQPDSQQQQRHQLQPQQDMQSHQAPSGTATGRVRRIRRRQEPNS